MQKELLLKEFKDVESVIELLKSSVSKFKSYNPKRSYTPEELEYYDSLSFRFEKVIEIMLNFYKGLEMFLYARTSDTLRNLLLIMQKLNLTEDIEFWMEARILRNKIVHTYEPEKLKELYEEIKGKSIKTFTHMDKIAFYLKTL